MSRKKRVWFPGAVYHIMCRGNRKSEIFKDQEDYLAFISILKKVQEKYGYVLYSYCLMTNHVHLQMETENSDISIIMRSINLFYTKYFNNKYNLIGHLFQGRYISELIQNAPYSIKTSRYIHLNPLKAKMVNGVSDYRWSSYDIYIGNRKCILVNESKILQYFKDSSRELYKDYVDKYLELDDENCELFKNWRNYEFE